MWCIAIENTEGQPRFYTLGYNGTDIGWVSSFRKAMKFYDLTSAEAYRKSKLAHMKCASGILDFSVGGFFKLKQPEECRHDWHAIAKRSDIGHFECVLCGSHGVACADCSTANEFGETCYCGFTNVVSVVEIPFP